MRIERYKTLFIFAIVLAVCACGRNTSEQGETDQSIISTPIRTTTIPITPTSPNDLDQSRVEEEPIELTMLNLKLSYQNRFNIKNKAEGLSEPSGLVLSANRDGLWVVDDKASKIFRLDLQGGLQPNQTLSIPMSGFEGATLDPTGAYLLVVLEESNELVKIDLTRGTIVERRGLTEMAGYEMVANAFTQGGKNKGLEGITWDADLDRLFVLKEAKPGLILEISTDMTTIYSHRVLDTQNGFVDDTVSGDALDFSGLFYDAARRVLWIVSDKGQRIFLYDWDANQVAASLPLAYTHKGKNKEIEQAEGVAIDPIMNRLYVVSDAEARLYIFDIQ